MNITEYLTDDVKAEVYNARMMLKQDYSIMNADEAVYKYVGMNSVRPFTAIIHPEDLESFYEAVGKLDQGIQHLLVRLMADNGHYRSMYAVMQHYVRKPDGERCIGMELLDVMQVHDKYDQMQSCLQKYRKFMTLSTDIYFEYFYEERIVNIYEYVNGLAEVLLSKKIDELYEKICQSGEYSDRQRQEFTVLYDSLTKAADNIELKIDGALFGMGNCRLKLKGGILYCEDRKIMMVALMNRLDTAEAAEDEKYYTQSYAIDAATSVYNKRAISELAVDVVAEAGENRLYVIMMDLDDFKLLNDTYGHLAGDEILAKVAEIIKSIIGPRGYVGRFGGDEFFVITDRVKTDEELTYALKTIRKHIAWNCRKIIPDMIITTSIGIAKYPEDGRTYEELFKIADKCLYIAKAKGKNRFILYDPKVHKDVEMSDTPGRFGTAGLVGDSYQICTAACKVITAVRKDGIPGLGDNLDNIRRLFDLDGITIYVGQDYLRAYTSGKYDNPLAKADFLKSPQVDSFFDENGVFCVNKILTVRERCPEVYDALTSQGDSGFIMVRSLLLEQGAEPVAIAFEIFGRKRKWSDNEKAMLMMIARTIMEILTGNRDGR
ncbi:MAG: GGDEF domain-containing protein [Lachnospiraceae bacterium]|nr:GGDEF domain-containing protein [Lachnospiraceae bacterium]